VQWGYLLEVGGLSDFITIAALREKMKWKGGGGYRDYQLHHNSEA